MIYEHRAPAGLFTIEWTWIGGTGPKDEKRWVGCCNGETLVHASSPEAVLERLLKGECKPTPRGINPASASLPASLDRWNKVRS